MKQNLFAFLLLLPFLSYSQITIKGKIHNYDGESVVWYYPTLEGIYAPKWYEIKPKRNGKFKIQIQNQGLGTIELGFKRATYRLMYDENSEIELEIDQHKIKYPPNFPRSENRRDSVRKAALISIKGDYEQVNNFYNQQIRTAYTTTASVSGNYYSRKIYKIESPRVVFKVLDSLVQIEVNQIEKLDYQLGSGDNPYDDSEVKEYLKNEVKAFYMAIFFNAMFLKRKEQVMLLNKDSSVQKTIYNEKWEHLIETVSEKVQKEIKPLPSSKDYNQLTRHLFGTLYEDSYKSYTFSDNKSTIEENIVNRLLHTDSLLHLDKTSLLALKLFDFRRYVENQLFYSPVLLDAVYEFKRRYPGSSHIENFQSNVEKIEDYVKELGKEYNKARVIETNYTTFADLISEFKGQNLLLDIWATWCHPCVQDFQYKDIISDFIKGKNLTTLYISIDPPKWEERWRNSIKYNELDGYHIRPNKEFIVNMWDILGGSRGAIPRYVLINKEGEIVNATAARPGDGSRLFSQMEEMLREN